MAKPNEQPKRQPVRWTRRGLIVRDVAFVCTVLAAAALLCTLATLAGGA